MRIVLDTNVLVSGFIFPGGIPDKILRAVLAKTFEHFSSPDLLTEFREVLSKKFKIERAEIEDILEPILNASQIAYPTQRIKGVTADDADHRVLECAVEASAEYIVTGDQKHLLPLKIYDKIQIVNPRNFALTTGLV